MARVLLDIEDPTSRLTLEAILEAEGHRVVGDLADVAIADDPAHAVAHAKQVPSLMLAKAGDLRHAVAAMREGVYGYLFVPFQPGEAGIMVERALGAGRPSGGRGGPRLEAVTIQEAESQHILSVLRQCKGNQTKAARLLGIGRNTLWRKLKRIRAQAERNGSA